MSDTILAIDPGREKCGLAVLHRHCGVLEKTVIASGQLLETLQDYCTRFDVEVIVLGNGTSSAEKAVSIRDFLHRICARRISLQLINEYKTTESARIRYWQENPPKGWRRLLPLTMQVPPVPVDDVVAVLLGEKYFNLF